MPNEVGCANSSEIGEPRAFNHMIMRIKAISCGQRNRNHGYLWCGRTKRDFHIRRDSEISLSRINCYRSEHLVPVSP